MSESKTPICDLIERLLSRDLSPGTLGQALAAARPVEEAMLRVATIASASTADRREKERLRKAAYRADKRENVPGQNQVDYISSISPKTQSLFKEEDKKESSCPTVPRDKRDTTDDWPEDFQKQFWDAFPKKRRYDKPQVMAFLVKLRREKTVTWSVLFEGLRRYVASDPGDYAKAPLPWLRGHRWEAEYGKQVSAGGSNGESTNRRNGGSSDPILAAARRRGGAMRGNDQAPGGEDAIPSSGGMDDGRGVARGSEDQTLDLDLPPGPGGRLP